MRCEAKNPANRRKEETSVWSARNMSDCSIQRNARTATAELSELMAGEFKTGQTRALKNLFRHFWKFVDAVDASIFRARVKAGR